VARALNVICHPWLQRKCGVGTLQRVAEVIDYHQTRNAAAMRSPSFCTSTLTMLTPLTVARPMELALTGSTGTSTIMSKHGGAAWERGLG